MQYQLPIIGRREVAENTTEVTFDTAGHELNFKAGQYANITLSELLFIDPKGPSRSFSIVSSPYTTGTLSIVFRNSPSGFKRTLLEVPLGTNVEVDCGHGSFTLPDDPTLPVIFVAGGVGIAPCLSILRAATEEKRSHRITLIYGNHHKESAAYLAELESISSQNPHITVKTIFGALTKESIEEQTPFETEAMWFVVGPSDMTEAVSDILKNVHIPESHVRTEEFSGYKSITRVLDTEERAMQKEMQGIPSSMLEGILEALNKTTLVSVTDAQGNITYANDMFVNISKYSREELIGQNHRMLKSGFHPPEFYEKMWRTVSSGEIFRGEVKNKAKDGSFYWVDASIAPIFDKDGKITGYVAARFPITEQKLLEEQFKQRAEELKDFNKVMVGREMKMIELKEELAQTKKEIEALKQGSSNPAETA